MKIGIYGYGNLAKGVEAAVENAPDIELLGVFTRRDPQTVHTVSGVPVYAADTVLQFQDQLDVLVICGGSAFDLPEMTPALAAHFCVVDSFDTHANIPAHFAKVDAAAKAGDTLALISGGWDPGMFSVMRMYANAILPDGCDYTFWGRGVSQGHSDAARRVDGVQDARQYTVPVPQALQRVRDGENPSLTTREKHTREVFVVPKEGADRERITREICEMPNYYADYDTTVTFITAEEMRKEHTQLPHGGTVIRSGVTGEGHHHIMEFHLQLDSNPEYTGSVLLCCARAVHAMYHRGRRGCISMLDVAPADLSALSGEDLRAKLL